MGELEEYRAIVSKLLDRTEKGKVIWDAQSWGFSTTLRESSTSSFQFGLTAKGTTESRTIYLFMRDSQGQELFSVGSTDLPTNPAEEGLSDDIEKLYEAARRQALKIPEKIKTVSDLLDRA